jgi:hypothetical protein
MYYWYRSDKYMIVSPYFTKKEEALRYRKQYISHWWRLEDSPYLELLKKN